MAAVAVGAQVGPFRIDAEIGRGGMGVVYRAWQKALDREVALKVIGERLAGDAQSRERFRREARLAASVEHPNVLPVYEAGAVDDLLYVAMRFVEGADLGVLIRAEQGLGAERAVGIVAQVAEGLDAAHRCGLVHRDIKPQNVLVAEPGGSEHVYLSDFGLARLVDGGEQLTGSGGWLGTLDYCAPEQLRNEPVDARADIYALGCLLYEALSGRPPFDRRDVGAKVLAHLNESAPPLPDLAVESRFGEVIARATAKSPGDRYDSAAELAAELIASQANATQERSTISVQPARPANRDLPAIPWPTIGREAELEQCLGHLANHVRLLTITGPGGVGKTRLAAELARSTDERYPQGVHYVPLAPVRRPRDVAPAALRALRTQPEPGETARAALARHLSGQRCLLVFDNFEHVRPAASLVSELLVKCAGLDVVVTSRSALQLGDEQVFPLAPLGLPSASRAASPTAFRSFSATALFSARARARDPRFSETPENRAAVRTICAAVDGLPLGIELAAARTSLLTPTELAQRLDEAISAPIGSARDAPARHRTLHATIDWSYRLLDDDARAALPRLSVFAGGFTASPAEAVAGAPLRVLGALVDASLVIRGSDTNGLTRFDLLETVRRFASDQLEEGPDAEAVRARHCDYFVKLAVDATGGGEPGEQLGLGRFEAELENCRVALHWAQATNHQEEALRLAAAFGDHAWVRGQREELQEILDWALDLPPDAPAAPQAAALLALGSCSRYLNDHRRSTLAYELARDRFRQLGDVNNVVEATTRLVFNYEELGATEHAEELADKALELARGCSDWHMARALKAAGATSKDPDRRRALLDQSAEIFRRLGEKLELAGVLTSIGYLTLERSEDVPSPALARSVLPVLRESTDIGRELNAATALANNLANLALAELLADEDPAPTAAEAVAVTRAGQAWLSAGELLRVVAALAGERGDIGAAAELWSAAVASEVGQATPRCAIHLERRFLDGIRTTSEPTLWQHAWVRGEALALDAAMARASRALRAARRSKLA